MKISTFLLGSATGAAFKSALVAVSIKLGEVQTSSDAFYSMLFWTAVAFAIFGIRNIPRATSQQEKIDATTTIT